MSNFVSNLFEKYEAEAAEYAKKYGISDSNEDTNKKWDAFRHAYSSAAMTQDFSILVAAAAGDAWEVLGRLNGAEYADSNMDYWNNHVGRQIGRASSSRDEIAEKIVEALNKGDLIIDKTGTIDKREFPFDLPAYQKHEKGIDSRSKLNQINDIYSQEREKVSLNFKAENEPSLSNSYLANLSSHAQKLFQQYDEKFTALCEKRGITADCKEDFENLRGAAVATALANGLPNIEKVDIDSQTRMLWLGSYNPRPQITSLSVDEAVNIPMSESMAKIHTIEQQNAQQAQERQMAQSQQQNHVLKIG